MVLSAGTRLGSYEILSPLGAGGMGEVYRARHVKLRREAAIKVLPNEFASDPERLRRFEREARAASALNHPAIVTIYDIDEHQGTSYIAMELVGGVTLRERLADRPLDTKEALRLAISIADGLSRAHAAGVVHRDLKPENVMITEDGQVKILDFGLAKQIPAGLDAPTALTTMTRMTRPGAVLGTVSYMSPEQAAGRAVDQFSDQFSFGVVLYEMLCGQLPFRGGSVATVLSAILRDAPQHRESSGPRHRGMSCWNEAEEGRYILGGAWGEPSYFFRISLDARPPFARDPTHGFRCARFRNPPSEELLGSFVPSYSLISRGERTPLTDEVFEAYRRMYAYDPSDLEAVVESVDESSPHWRKETVSFKAAYGGERVIAHLLLPRNADPPYQAVIWFPGDDVFFFPVGGGLASRYLFDFIPRSGRALGYPVYKGTYERHVPFSFAPNEWRDMMIMWSKNLSRTVDLLEERPDIDPGKLAYYGFSGGAMYGPVFTAVDRRFEASVLLGGGLVSDIAPEMDPANFAPRSPTPTLMINGESDFINTYGVSQVPLFRLLGAPEGEKRHALLDGGHIPSDRLALIEEVLTWLERFLGPVEAKGAGAPP